MPPMKMKEYYREEDAIYDRTCDDDEDILKMRRRNRLFAVQIFIEK